MLRLGLARILLLLGGLSTASAEIVRVEISPPTQVAGGRAWGLAGPYERVAGRLYFEVDPELPANRIIADIERAPRNAAGRVEYSSEFYLLKPVRMESGNGSVLFDVMNRGRKRILYYFNDAPSRSAPLTADDMGDGLLLRQGYSLLWVGWQFDVPPETGLMRVLSPVATANGRPIEGIVRSDFVVSERVFDHSLGDRGHVAYGASNPADPRNVLTVRDTAMGERTVIPRDMWQFGRYEDGRMVPDPTRVFLLGGFEPERIYEVVYVAEDPPVAGLGLAALRDTAAYLKYANPAALGIPAGAIRTALAFGDSQTGRALRTFIYDGFNADEQQRRAFDGIIAHLGANARGSFNQRFAQPSRAVDRNYAYPNDLFPFSDTEQTDPLTGRTEGLLSRTPPQAAPKVFYTNSSTEYWRLPAALIHTSVDGSRDVAPTEQARIYLFAGTQHVPARLPQAPADGLRVGNPNDYRWFLRALLGAMQRWIDDGTAPPPSRYPTRAEGSLVSLEELAFPRLPQLAVPRDVARGYRLDYGPRFESEGVITREPPAVIAALPFLVSQVDASGNELGGLRSPALAAPLATYTGWSPFSAISTAGTYLPFARTRAEREAAGDPRLSIEERYLNEAHYLGLVAESGLALIDEGYILAQDLPAILAQAQRHWALLHSRP
jgi:hypothetical protein